MSTKCTILYDEEYHLYFDYKDRLHHLKCDSNDGMQHFLERVGKILTGCPFSDSGVYLINLEDNTCERMNYELKCEALEEAKKKCGKKSS